MSQNKNLSHVFKLTDSNGKISYSASIPGEFIQTEKIVIATPPSEQHIENTRQRYDKLKAAAVELGIADIQEWVVHGKDCQYMP